MEEFVDYYGILELQKDASIEDIEEAIKKTRKRFRRLEGSPDAMQRTNAEKMMQRLNEADTLFHDDFKRAKYDASYDARKTESKKELNEKASSSTEKDWLEDAESYYDAGQYSNAFFAASEATRADASNERAWMIRGMAAQGLKKYPEVVYAVSEVLKLSPNNVFAHKVLANAYFMMDDYAKAEAQLRTAQKIDPADYLIMAQLVDVKYFHGDYDQALTMSRNLYEAHPDCEQIKDSLARCLIHDAEDKMSSEGDKVCFTNVKQLQYVEQIIEELRKLEDLNFKQTKWIVSTTENIDWCRRRHYVQQEGLAKAIVIAVVILWMGMAAGPVVGLMVVAAYALILAFKVFPEGWRLNKRRLGDAAWKTGLQ